MLEYIVRLGDDKYHIAEDGITHCGKTAPETGESIPDDIEFDRHKDCKRCFQRSTETDYQ